MNELASRPGVREGQVKEWSSVETLRGVLCFPDISQTGLPLLPSSAPSAELATCENKHWMSVCPKKKRKNSIPTEREGFAA
jgi:hypothetical protein